MKRKDAVLLCVCASIVSFAFGAYISAWFFDSVHTTLEAARSENELRHRLAILKLLRSGKADRAIEHLEVDMDGAVIALSHAMESGQFPFIRGTETIAKVANYRKEFPREFTSDLVRSNVESALRLRAR